MRITLRAVEGGLLALVVAERPETADLMRRHADLLETALREAGGRAVSVDVSSGGRDARGEAAPEGAGASGAPTAEAPAMAAARAPGPRPAARGLDLRL